MARRRQRPTKRQRKALYVCTACERGDCSECVDVFRAAVGQSMRCTCTRKGHTGEPGDRNDNDQVANDLVIQRMEEEFE
jgi:hypothetical protein